MAGYGKTISQVLELLAAGALLGFVKTKKERIKILEQSDDIWFSIDQKRLRSIIKSMKIGGLIKTMAIVGGNKITLSESGRMKHLKYKFHNLKLIKKPKRWDKKWRMVLFDIPEHRRKVRDGLRKKLKELGFLEFQKSVFIFPYPCDDEINFIINFFDISDLVYCLETRIAPDNDFRLHFKLR